MTKIKTSYKFKEIKKRKNELGSELGVVIDFNSAERIKMRTWSDCYPLIDRDKCLGCGLCVDYCPEGAIEIKIINGKKKTVIDYSFCKGCVICAEQCPRKAIKI